MRNYFFISTFVVSILLQVHTIFTSDKDFSISIDPSVEKYLYEKMPALIFAKAYKENDFETMYDLYEHKKVTREVNKAACTYLGIPESDLKNEKSLYILIKKYTKNKLDSILELYNKDFLSEKGIQKFHAFYDYNFHAFFGYKFKNYKSNFFIPKINPIRTEDLISNFYTILENITVNNTENNNNITFIKNFIIADLYQNIKKDNPSSVANFFEKKANFFIEYEEYNLESFLIYALTCEASKVILYLLKKYDPSLFDLLHYHCGFKDFDPLPYHLDFYHFNFKKNKIKNYMLLMHNQYPSNMISPYQLLLLNIIGTGKFIKNKKNEEIAIICLKKILSINSFESISHRRHAEIFKRICRAFFHYEDKNLRLIPFKDKKKFFKKIIKIFIQHNASIEQMLDVSKYFINKDHPTFDEYFPYKKNVVLKLLKKVKITFLKSIKNKYHSNNLSPFIPIKWIKEYIIENPYIPKNRKDNILINLFYANFFKNNFKNNKLEKIIQLGVPFKSINNAPGILYTITQPDSNNTKENKDELNKYIIDIIDTALYYNKKEVIKALKEPVNKNIPKTFLTNNNVESMDLTVCDNIKNNNPDLYNLLAASLQKNNVSIHTLLSNKS